MRCFRVANGVGNRPVHAVNGDESETVHTDLARDLGNGKMGCDQLVPAWRVDAVKTGMRRRRAGDAHMHLGRAGVAHHGHNLARGGATHDRIIDKNDPLAAHRLGVGIVLQLDRIGAVLLCRLDEGAADIMIADDAKIEGDRRRLGIAERRRHAGIGHRNDQIGVDVRFTGQFGTDGFAGVIDAAALDHRIWT